MKAEELERGRNLLAAIPRDDLGRPYFHLGSTTTPAAVDLVVYLVQHAEDFLSAARRVEELEGLESDLGETKVALNKAWRKRDEAVAQLTAAARRVEELEAALREIAELRGDACSAAPVMARIALEGI